MLTADCASGASEPVSATQKKSCQNQFYYPQPSFFSLSSLCRPVDRRGRYICRTGTRCRQKPVPRGPRNHPVKRSLPDHELVSTIGGICEDRRRVDCLPTDSPGGFVLILAEGLRPSNDGPERTITRDYRLFRQYSNGTIFNSKCPLDMFPFATSGHPPVDLPFPSAHLSDRIAHVGP